MRSHELNRALAPFAIVALVAACSRTTEQTDKAARALTFNADIAPILFANCASCHRPIEDPPSPKASAKAEPATPKPTAKAGSSDDPLCVAGAPFSVLDYGSVRRHARAISSAVQRRAMPPWLPEPGHGEFAGERRLRDDQIALIAKWVESGAPEGNSADAPKPPTFSGGWQLGTPDLVLTLPEAYVLQPQRFDSAPFDSAQGKQGRPGTRDVFRNFVIPVPITTTRYVRAVEFRADRPQVLHHADVAIDLGRVSRALDRAEPGPGFAAMDSAQVYNVYGWSPGKVPVMEPSDNAWTINPGADLILLLHMIAGAKNETVQPAIGLFFSDTSPTRTPISVKLEAHGIAIPAGESNYVVEDSYVLPVDVEAVSVYPHAHYLGKEMRGTATLPDGSQKDLLWIRQWDFRWQDRYRYRSPVSLPRGTKLSMRFTYDNSAANRNNRSDPPQRVRSGPRSTDEMGQLWIEVVPRRAEDAAVLNADFVRRSLEAAIASAEMDVRLDPQVAAGHSVLATRYLQAGRVVDAQAQLEEALRLDPRDAEAHSNLGTVLQARGLLAQGMQHLRTAVQLKPKGDSVHFNLGAGLLAVGQPDAAIREFQTTIALNPENADAHFNLGVILGPRNQLDNAIAHLQRAVEINPLNADAYHNLSVAYALQRRLDEAITSAQTAVRLKPDSAPAREMLQRLLAARNR
ncbi:MAG TPA: tetratricopeptide repeat protein [Vicinamibacterales bacterium]|nr:tetratricopeptide repeat protein [Vicinamibacterales bacterium]